MKTLSIMSNDKINRQAYQRRLDELYFHNAELAQKDAIIADQETKLADRMQSWQIRTLL